MPPGQARAGALDSGRSRTNKPAQDKVWLRRRVFSWETIYRRLSMPANLGHRRCKLRSSMFPDALTHWRFFIWMLPLPPLQVVQVAAKRDGCALQRGDGNPVVDGCPTLAADAALNELRRNQSVPGNAPVSVLIDAGSIDGANRFAGAGVPILAVSPVVGQYSHAANLAE